MQKPWSSSLKFVHIQFFFLYYYSLPPQLQFVVIITLIFNSYKISNNDVDYLKSAYTLSTLLPIKTYNILHLILQAFDLNRVQNCRYM